MWIKSREIGGFLADKIMQNAIRRGPQTKNGWNTAPVLEFLLLVDCVWWLIVIEQNALPGTLQIVKLAVLGRPPKGGADTESDHHAERNQQDQDFHAVLSVDERRRIKRNEFATTISELEAMPMAAHAGEMNPATANGIAIRL